MSRRNLSSENDNAPIQILHRSGGPCMNQFVRQATLITAIVLLIAVDLRAVGQEGGPRQILITYRCRPSDRPAFHDFLAAQESRMLDKLKADGTLGGYQILFNPVVTETFDALLILDFRDDLATERWLNLERTLPGGLSPAGQRLAEPQMTYFADLQWEGTSSIAPSSHPVFYAIPYSYNSLDQYKTYVDAYVIPQVKGWMEEGVLSHYAIYLNRYNVGPPWDALFVYEYHDLQALGEREKTIAKVRATLRSDPTWIHWNDVKSTVRSESENTVLEEVRPSRPAAGIPDHGRARTKTPASVEPR